MDFAQLCINVGLNGGELAAIDLDDDATPTTRDLGAGLEHSNRLSESVLALGTFDRDWGSVEDHKPLLLTGSLTSSTVAGSFTSSTPSASVKASPSPSGQILNPPFPGSTVQVPQIPFPSRNPL